MCGCSTDRDAKWVVNDPPRPRLLMHQLGEPCAAARIPPPRQSCLRTASANPARAAAACRNSATPGAIQSRHDDRRLASSPARVADIDRPAKRCPPMHAFTSMTARVAERYCDRSLVTVVCSAPTAQFHALPCRPTPRAVARECPMRDEVTKQARRRLASGVRGCLTFGIPAAILLISPTIGTRYLVIVWPVLLTFMSVACLLNAVTMW